MSHSSTVAQPPPPVPEAMEIEGVWIVRTSKRSPIRILGLNNSLGILGQSHVPNPTRMRLCAHLSNVHCSWAILCPANQFISSIKPSQTTF